MRTKIIQLLGKQGNIITNSNETITINTKI